MKKRKSQKPKLSVRRLVILSLILILTGLSTIPHIQSAATEKYVRDRVVWLASLQGMCSGFQAHVGDIDVVVSAAHCSMLRSPEGNIMGRFDGQIPIPLQILFIDEEHDLMVLEGLPNRKGLEIADHTDLFRLYTSYTHGEMKPTWRADGVMYSENEHILVGVMPVMSADDEKKCLKNPKNKIDKEASWCVTERDEMISSIYAEPGSSGGVVVNSQGQVVGVINIKTPSGSGIVPLKYLRSILGLSNVTH